ncbi:hypothetical protein UlMin_036635 [Ulmus minor]
MEIILEILSRVSSIKSLTQWKCVCKTWHSLLSDSTFIRMHHKHQLSSILVYHVDRYRCGFFSGLTVSIHSPKSIKEPSKYRFPIESPFLRVESSHKGILCVSDGPCVYLWNPTIRETRKLPKLCSWECQKLPFGFGYDPSMDDLKVVGLWERSSDNLFQGAVYSLRNDYWKTIEVGDMFSSTLGPHRVMFAHLGKQCPVVVNGFLHWLFYYLDTSSSGSTTPYTAMVTFNLREEGFALEILPENLKLKAHAFGNLFGCLSLLSCGFDQIAEIWVMKEYGISESWTKQFSINLAGYYTPIWQELKIKRFLGFGYNGEVLMADHLYSHEKLIWYDLKSGKVEEWSADNSSRVGESTGFVQSMVSPIKLGKSLKLHM